MRALLTLPLGHLVVPMTSTKWKIGSLSMLYTFEIIDLKVRDFAQIRCIMGLSFWQLTLTAHISEISCDLRLLLYQFVAYA